MPSQTPSLPAFTESLPLIPTKAKTAPAGRSDHLDRSPTQPKRHRQAKSSGWALSPPKQQFLPQEDRSRGPRVSCWSKNRSVRPLPDNPVVLERRVDRVTKRSDATTAARNGWIVSDLQTEARWCGLVARLGQRPGALQHTRAALISNASACRSIESPHSDPTH